MNRLEDSLLYSLGTTREALLVIDQDQRIIYWNEGAKKLLGYSAADVLGKPCWRVIGGRRSSRPFCEEDCRIQRCLFRDIPPPHHYFVTRTKKGRTIWVGVSVLRLKMKGKPVSAHLLTNVSREERLRETLLKMQGAVQVNRVIRSE